MAVAGGHRFGLDAVRGLAAAAVMVCHFGVWWLDLIPGSLDVFQLLGFLGVETFFVLSGFLIGGVLLRDRPKSAGSLGRFWLRRALRTLPAFYVVVIVLAVLSPPPADGLPLWRYLTHTAWLPVITNPAPWFGVSWSLAVEEWSYLVVPVLLAVALRRGAHPAKVILAWLAAAVAVRWFVVIGMGLPWTDTIWGTPFRLDPIAWGMLAAACRHLPNPRMMRMAGWGSPLAVAVFGASWIAGGTALTDTALFRTAAWTALDVALAFGMLALAAARRPAGAWTHRSDALALLSYPLYLVHTPIAQALGSSAPGLASAAAKTMLAVAAAWACAWALHRFVEQPALEYGVRFKEKAEAGAGEGAGGRTKI